MGGFLLCIRSAWGISYWVSGPSRGLGGFLRKRIYTVAIIQYLFPAPIEAWVGSYLVGKKEKNEFSFIVSGPYRGMSGFLRW